MDTPESPSKPRRRKTEAASTEGNTPDITNQVPSSDIGTEDVTVIAKTQPKPRAPRRKSVPVPEAEIAEITEIPANEKAPLSVDVDSEGEPFVAAAPSEGHKAPLPTGEETALNVIIENVQTIGETVQTLVNSVAEAALAVLPVLTTPEEANIPVHTAPHDEEVVAVVVNDTPNEQTSHLNAGEVILIKPNSDETLPPFIQAARPAIATIPVNYGLDDEPDLFKPVGATLPSSKTVAIPDSAQRDQSAPSLPATTNQPSVITSSVGVSPSAKPRLVDQTKEQAEQTAKRVAATLRTMMIRNTEIGRRTLDNTNQAISNVSTRTTTSLNKSLERWEESLKKSDSVVLISTFVLMLSCAVLVVLLLRIFSLL